MFPGCRDILVVKGVTAISGNPSSVPLTHLRKLCHSLEYQHQGFDALDCLHRHLYTGDITHTHISIKKNNSQGSVSQVVGFGNHGRDAMTWQEVHSVNWGGSRLVGRQQ